MAGSSFTREDPETLLRVRNLDLRSKLVVQGFLTGLHRSPFHGFSAEFSEYRPYSRGDDLRYLDWRLLARSDRKYVKRFEEETNLRAHFLVDFSRSMSYSQERSAKSEYALTLAATLARFLSLQRDAVGLITFAGQILDALPASTRAGHLGRVFAALERATTGEATALVETLEHAGRLLHARGLVVLFSDLLAPLEGLDSAFGQVRARGHEMIVFRVLDPSELEFSFDQPATFEDLETGRSFYVDPAVAAASYREAFAEHRAGLQRLCHGHGVDLVDWSTDRSLPECLGEYLAMRARRGRSVLRRSREGAS